MNSRPSSVGAAFSYVARSPAPSANKGRLPEAEQSARRAISVQEKIVREHPNVSRNGVTLGDFYAWLSMVLHWMGPQKDSEAARSHAIVLKEELAVEFPEVAQDPRHRQALALDYSASWCRAGGCGGKGSRSGEPSRQHTGHSGVTCYGLSEGRRISIQRRDDLCQPGQSFSRMQSRHVEAEKASRRKRSNSERA